MKKSRAIILMMGILLPAISSCSKNQADTGSLYVPTSADVSATASLSDLQKGRTIYINNCGACHGYYSPDNYSASGWRSILQNMVPRTGISAADASLLSKYVTRGR
ncbi:MAG: hypothetical protein H6540_05825 [Bacteroidales bacterium]|nr:hypothetical protein [Bacteroidales bacterium]MCB9013664.1 hypothetical protein [Bacteroidales bacterium]